eukprot:Lankesteria_metandrocarpae@DN4169_c1_g1_i1.p1
MSAFSEESPPCATNSRPVAHHGEGKQVLDEIRSSLLNYYSVLYSLDGLALHDRLNFLSNHGYPSPYPICDHRKPPPTSHIHITGGTANSTGGTANSTGGTAAAVTGERWSNSKEPPPPLGLYSRHGPTTVPHPSITGVLDTLAATFDARPNENFVGHLSVPNDRDGAVIGSSSSAADARVSQHISTDAVVHSSSHRRSSYISEPTNSAATTGNVQGVVGRQQPSAPVSKSLIERRLVDHHADNRRSGGGSNCDGGAAGKSKTAILNVLGDMCNAVGDTNKKLDRLEALANSVSGDPNCRGFAYRCAPAQLRRPRLAGAHNDGVSKHLIGLYAQLQSQNELNKSRIRIIEANLNASRSEYVGAHNNNDARIGH